jgi:hypothetical protein
MKLNGASVASVTGFTSLTPFSITSGFVNGVNSLDIVVTNDPSSSNPTGLRVEISGTATPAAGVVPIVIYNTGVATGGSLLADGAIDPHYTITSSADLGFPGPSAFVINSSGFPIPPWAVDGPISKWIGPQANQSTGNAQGAYTYHTTFDLTGFNPATAVLAGQWAADNSAVMKLNGVTMASEVGFTSLTPFSISSGFVSGVNSLDILVTNDPATPNPTGLRLEISGTVSH